MGSERQVEANRGNALRSTGPKTLAGKRVVARNAVKHGLLSRELVLPDESPSMLNELRARLRADLRPEGTLEDVLVDRIVASIWRLRRLGRVEMGLFAFRRYRDAAARAESHEAFLKETRSEAFHGAEVPQLARAFEADERAFANLSRYETAIERGLYKALHELQRLQALRAGQVVPPPAAVDLTVLQE
jgi:hypothetical protein